MAYQGMTQEQIFVSLQNDNAQLKADMLTMKSMLEQATAAGATAGAGQGSGGNSPDWGEGKGFGKGGYQSLMD